MMEAMNFYEAADVDSDVLYSVRADIFTLSIQYPPQDAIRRQNLNPKPYFNRRADHFLAIFARSNSIECFLLEVVNGKDVYYFFKRCHPAPLNLRRRSIYPNNLAHPRALSPQ